MDEDRTKRPGYGSYGEWEWDDDHPLVAPHSLTNADVGDPPQPGDDRPLYDGRPVRDPYARRGGYRHVPDEVWAQAGQAYLNGDSAETVCDRHGLALSTFRQRARAQGWRRRDQDWVDPEPVDLAAEVEAGLPDYADIARHALVRLNRAVLAGRAVEAARWMRIHRQMLAFAQQDPRADHPPSGEVAAQPTEGALPTPRSPKPQPAPRPADPLDLAMTQARLAETLARSAGSLLTLGEPGRRLIDKGMEALAFMSAPSPSNSAISDDSDGSDSVFPNGADQPEATPPEPGQAPP
ncbi:hypothetical protein [Brevundimonas sp.]|jgi:hypothetical protein|uniref:hypothetical protein n=1 Tax=Brevundimonas sp. TaxID=1871086 RepID=UPI0037C173F3